MARFQHTESAFSAAIRGALTGFVLAAVATVCLATAAERPSGGSTVELRLDAAKVDVASSPAVVPFQHTAPVRPAA